MWALAVVVAGVDAEHVLEVAPADDQQPVETFGADRAREAIGVGVLLTVLPNRHILGESVAPDIA